MRSRAGAAPLISKVKRLRDSGPARNWGNLKMEFQNIRKNAWVALLFAGALLAGPRPAMAGGAADAAATAAPNALPAAPVPSAAAAQESQALETMHLGQPKLGKSRSVKGVEGMPSRREWVALAAAEHGAAAFDAYSTRQAIGRGAVEADPMMRPFAGSPSIYAAIQVAPLALDYAARRLQRSQNPLLRKMWWLPQSGGTAMYLFSGVHNLGVAGRP